MCEATSGAESSMSDAEMQEVVEQSPALVQGQAAPRVQKPHFKNIVKPGPQPGTIRVMLTPHQFSIVDDTAAVRKILAKYKFRINGKGYAVHILPGPNGKKYGGVLCLHHLIMGRKPEKGMDTDHANGNRLDNRAANLRIVSKRVNATNQNHLKATNTSGITGVYRQSGRQGWVASWQDISGKRKFAHFADSTYGGRARAFEIAKARRDEETAKQPIYIEARQRFTETTTTTTTTTKTTEFK